MKILLLVISVFFYIFLNLAYGGKMLEFNGQTYNDDRLFVLHVAKCTVVDDNADEIITVYHKNIPLSFKWCVITYRNVARYMPFRVDYFDTENEANIFSKATEPLTPMISLGGNSYNPPETYEKFYQWKKRNNLQEYNYKKVFLEGDDPREIIVQEKH